MKIMHVAPVQTDRSSGVSIYVSQLVSKLIEHGVDIGLMSNSFGRHPQKGDIAGCCIMDGPTQVFWNPWRIDNCWIESIEREFGQPDLVHFHCVYYPFQAALARQMLKKGWKYITSPHGGLQDSSQKRKFLKKKLGNFLFFDNFIKNASAVHVLNEAEAEAVQKKYPGTRIIIVPNGISSDILSLPYESGSTIGRPLRVGFIGRIDIHQKGIDLLLGGVRLLQEKYPEIELNIILIGHYHQDNDRRILNQLISTLKRPQEVTLTGALNGPEKWNKLSSFDIFVHTSRYEGMPGAVIEAMAFAKPCLVTPATNMQNIVSNCNGGWVCDAGVKSIAKVLYSIIKNPADILRRGASAREFVRKHLTWDIIADDYVKKIKTLI